MNRLGKDFGVRALLATIAVAFYEVMLFVAMVFLYLQKTLNFEGAISILTLASAPALTALGFYFGTQLGKQNNTVPATPLVTPGPGTEAKP